MAQPRLTTALDTGALKLPDGPIVAMRPGAGYDLSAVPARPVIQHGFRPDWDYWQASGFETVAVVPDVATAIVVVPRSKALARAMVHEAVTKAGLVVVDGQRSEGIDSLWRDLRKLLGDMPCITKAHGRLMWFAGGAEVAAKLAAWAGAGPVVGAHGYHTQAGVFSEDAIDRGSQLLLSSLPQKLPSRMADLGAGWGFLARGMLEKHPNIASLDLIEAEALSLECARLNVTDPRAVFDWADVSQHSPQVRYDAIVSNPPFHVSRAADPSLGTGFIAAAAGMLTAQGTLWLVANRHLPYETALKEAFITVEEIAGDAAFKVFRAARPMAANKSAAKLAAQSGTRPRARVRSR